MMQENSKNIYLYANTVYFAQKLCQTINDITGVPFLIKKETVREQTFAAAHEMIAYIHVSGSIQGDYIISLNEKLACRLIGAYNDGMGDQEVRELREQYAGCVKELLNVAVGQSVVELEKSFGNLTFSSPTVVYGKIDFPEVMSGSIDIEGAGGIVQCAFSLNMANLKIGKKLEEALQDLERKTKEAHEAQRNIQNMLTIYPSGLVTINDNGEILPGHSKATAAVVGLPADTPIIGLKLSEILGISAHVADEWEKWLGLVYSKFAALSFEDIVFLCPINEFENDRAKVLKIGWLPIVKGAEDGGKLGLERMLVVIEDITKQRQIEREMKEINRRHQENLELLSEIINLEPDEVTHFVYDTSNLLSDAQSIIEGNNQDFEFVNGLFRTFHTIKGSSGQFQFKGLQSLAHQVEDYLKRFRDEQESIDTQSLDSIRNSIKEARGYLSRIEDLRAKLGSREETLKSKAVRNPNSVMVDLADIDIVTDHLSVLITKGENNHLDPYFVQELKDAHGFAKELRKVKLSFFLSSLQSLVQNSSQKLNKKADMRLGNDISVDVEVMRKVHHCFIHMINNAVDHGIENPDERRAAGKREGGLILLNGQVRNGAVEISIEDDGRGIDLDAVRDKLVNEGIFKLEDAAKLSIEELYRYLFKPGFTTRKVATITSGRGVGMDVIQDIVSKQGGSVSLESTWGKGTRVILNIPEKK
jgi:signal transduction histidine kinase/CheY-specific phosphatase CheX